MDASQRDERRATWTKEEARFFNRNTGHTFTQRVLKSHFINRQVEISGKGLVVRPTRWEFAQNPAGTMGREDEAELTIKAAHQLFVD